VTALRALRLLAVAGGIVFTPAVLTVVARAGQSDPDGRLRLVVSNSHGKHVRATAGTSALRTSDGTYLITDVLAEPAFPVRYLRASASERLRLRAGASVRRLLWQFASASDAPIGRQHTAAGSCRTRSIGLPQRIPRRVDRLSLSVDFSDGSIVGFEVGLQVRR